VIVWIRIVDRLCQRIYQKVVRKASNLVQVGEDLSRDYGIPIINKRISVTPISLVAEGCAAENYIRLAETTWTGRAAEVGVKFIGAFSALVPQGVYRRGHQTDQQHPGGFSDHGTGLRFG